MRVTWRADKEPSPLICALWRKGKQVCSITPQRLAPVDPKTVDFEADKSCEALMIAVGGACESGKIETKKANGDLDFYGYRDYIAKALGFVITKTQPSDTQTEAPQTVSKRPAKAEQVGKQSKMEKPRFASMTKKPELDDENKGTKSPSKASKSTAARKRPAGSQGARQSKLKLKKTTTPSTSVQVPSSSSTSETGQEHKFVLDSAPPVLEFLDSW